MEVKEIKFPTGEIYEGEVVDNVPHGKGIYKWTNGKIYEGEVQKGNITGFGKLKDGKHLTLIGLWKNSELVDGKQEAKIKSNFIRELTISININIIKGKMSNFSKLKIYCSLVIQKEFWYLILVILSIPIMILFIRYS